MPGRKKYRIIAFCVLACLVTNAQDTLNFNNVDAGTYKLYELKQWKQLQKSGAYVIKKGYDYYYLRMRLGIAAFESKAYRAAISHFNKALMFNADDNLAYEYLYYSYLYCEREEAAIKLSKKFSPDLAEYMKTSRLNPINVILSEGGTKLSDSSRLFKPPVYSQLALNHRVGRTLSLFHALTYYAQNENRFSTRQLQYYLRATVPLKKELTFTAGAHLLYGNPSYTEQAVVQFTVQDPPPFPGAPRPPVRNTSSLQTLQTVEQTLAFAGAAAISKHLQLADISLGTSVLLTDSATQLQVNAGFIYYPLKNNTLVLGANCYLHSPDFYSTTSLAWAPFITWRANKILFLNLSYFNNNGLNISEQNAYFINNSFDYTTQRWSFTPSCMVTKNFSIYGTFGLEEKKEISGAFIYRYLIFVLGIKINPFVK